MKVILLMIETEFFIFSSIEKMKEFLLGNEDYCFTEDLFLRLLEEYGIDTSYGSFVYGEYVIDEGFPKGK